MEGEIDRFPKADRYCHTRHSRPHLLPFQLPGTDRQKDDWYARKYLVSVLHCELTVRDCWRNVSAWLSRFNGAKQHEHILPRLLCVTSSGLSDNTPSHLPNTTE